MRQRSWLPNSFRLTKRTICWLVLLFLLWSNLAAAADTVTDINNQIQDKQQRLTELKKQIEAYQNAIVTKQIQASTLKKQLSVLDDKTAKAELDIKANELKLNTATLQIQAVTLDIGRRNQEISDKKSQIAELLRQINQADRWSMLEIFVLNSSLGQFFEQLAYLEALQGKLQQNINDMQKLKTELERHQQDLALLRTELVRQKEELELAKSTLKTDQETKQNLLLQTKQSESKFQTLLFQAQEEQEKANRDIQSLEQQIRQRLKQMGPSGLNQLNDSTLIWPVAPTRGISTYFYDPTYIFRRYFEHPGIDIPRPQGSDIKAAASGYVARAKDAGLGYSYIMLVHKGGISTVYGHVSWIDVTEDTFVTKGQVIGGVGGLPGTRGAGRLTTGPHLHFEVRSNGIPVNPLDYLP
ncbi:MAG: peptidoglycan DD-metalloendopeptidase family protein [Candidatus Kerfeldbacteria bacterium]|nr:peptidoglycan DD-metalloendopeptidase family protein [Candidatus Kerfeldbacteria bacterium]